jgi:mRNA interferase HigB
MGTGVPILGGEALRIIERKTLSDFWRLKKHSDSEQPLKAWFREAKRAEWGDWHEVKEQYRSASPLKRGRVVFNIAGNKYRLVVSIRYDWKTIFIRFIGTHEQYDATDAEII